MSPKQGRRADDISAEEIKQFWHDFCERKGVDHARARRREDRPGPGVLGRSDDDEAAGFRRHVATPRFDYLEFVRPLT